MARCLQIIKLANRIEKKREIKMTKFIKIICKVMKNLKLKETVN